MGKSLLSGIADRQGIRVAMGRTVFDPVRPADGEALPVIVDFVVKVFSFGYTHFNIAESNNPGNQCRN